MKDGTRSVRSASPFCFSSWRIYHPRSPGIMKERPSGESPGGLFHFVGSFMSWTSKTVQWGKDSE